MATTKRVPFLDRKLKQAFARIAADTAAGGDSPLPDLFARPVIPESVIRRIREYYERRGEMLEAHAGRGRAEV